MKDVGRVSAFVNVLSAKDILALFKFGECSITVIYYTYGRPQKFFQRGAKPLKLLKVDTFSARRTENRSLFRAPKAQTKTFAFFARFRPKYSVSIASAEGASENFRLLCWAAAYYDVIFSNSRGASAPPPPAGAHDYTGY